MWIYRAAITFAAPFILLHAILKMGGLTARLGFVRPAQHGAHIWVHAASNGEITSAKATLQALLRRDPSRKILVTTNQITARDMIRGWGNDRIEAHLAPIDLRWVTKMVLLNWSISAHIIVENEIWPNRLTVLSYAQIPVVIIGARLSARSAARWQKLPNSLRNIYRTLSLVSPQDRDSGARFKALGAPNISAPNNLKEHYQRPASHKDFAEFAQLYQAPFTVLGASTHAGEEKLILDAFDILHAADPRWHLILAPRHPKRRDEVLSLIGQRFSVAQYSDRTRRTNTTQITLADTMGDMALWYDIADICVVAGSFQPVGGHTPFEPLSHGCGVFHGPHVSNFTESYGALNAVGGAKMVRSAEDLAHAILTCRPNVMCDAAAPVLGRAQDQEPFYTELEAHLKRAPKAAS